MKNVIFIELNYPVKEYGISLHLSRLFSMAFINFWFLEIFRVFLVKLNSTYV